MTTPAPRELHRLLSLRVENKAGVLVRIAGLFSRRGFNIFSLAVAPTNDERFSRVSIVVDVESVPLQQVVEQLNKLIPVVEITELNPAQALEAELLLATLEVASGAGPAFEETIAHFDASVVDRSGELCTVQLAAQPGELDRFEEALRAYPIRALQRTGRIGLPKLTAAR